MNPDVQRKLDEIQKLLTEIRSGTDVQTYESIRRHISSGLLPIGAVSNNTGITKSVSEAGTASYSVADVPDAKLQVEANGQSYYIPLYNT